MTGKWLKVLSFVLAACAACAANATAQDYPVKPVRIMVPYAAGGVSDVLARAVSQRLSEAFSQQFLVENRGGGAGISAVMAVVKARPDGYTLLIADVAQTAINPHLFADLPYDTLKDLVPVTNVANSPQYVVASPSTKVGSFTELVTYAKANPGRLSYGSSGIGSVHHIAMESIKATLGIDVVHVPYKGSGQSVPAFLAGEVQVVIASLPSLSAHVKTGKARLLAVTSSSRSRQTPDVPTVSEFISGYDFITDNGLYAPVGTPAAIVSRLSTEVAKGVKHPDTASRLSGLGLEPVGNTPEEYAALIRRNLERYSIAVKQSGARVN